MTKQQVHEVLKSCNLAPNKRYGQNFLINEAAAAKIVDASDCTSKTVLEIGPGLGALTQLLIQRANKVTAVEIDAGYFRYLAEVYGNSLNLIHGDYLRIKPVAAERVVANLPYYCSSEMLFRIAETTGASLATVMVQKEMALRVLANPGTEDYGALGVSLWLYGSCSVLFDMHPEAFYPQPTVVSSVIQFVAIDRQLTPAQKSAYHELVKTGFWARRKTFYTCMTQSPFVTIEKQTARNIVDMLNKGASVRAEDLSPEEFLHSAKLLAGGR
jgi:16S rRNA (adenine1518-N6/adenine1519-N6)-dimethyltransferase